MRTLPRSSLQKEVIVDPLGKREPLQTWRHIGSFLPPLPDDHYGPVEDLLAAAPEIARMIEKDSAPPLAQSEAAG